MRNENLFGGDYLPSYSSQSERFLNLLEFHAKDILAFIKQLLGGEFDSGVFIEVRASILRRIEASPESFKKMNDYGLFKYTMKCLYHAAMKVYRRRKQNLGGFTLSIDEGIQVSNEEKDSWEEDLEFYLHILEENLSDLFGTLSHIEKNVVEFRIYKSLSHKEISNKLGITTAQSRQHLSRAIKKLRSRFSDYLDV